MRMREKLATRLTVHRSAKHIYAQIVSPEGDRILAQASTLDQSLRGGSTGNVEAAGKVGDLIALRAREGGGEREGEGPGARDGGRSPNTSPGGSWRSRRQL